MPKTNEQRAQEYIDAEISQLREALQRIKDHCAGDARPPLGQGTADYQFARLHYGRLRCCTRNGQVEGAQDGSNYSRGS
jgi:hypothetical protein